MYKPNFCAECGERVLPERWRLWSSRRFCAECAKRFRTSRLIWPLAAAAALFGLGLATEGNFKSKPPPLIIQSAQVKTASGANAVAPVGKASQSDAGAMESTGAGPDTNNQQPKPSPSYGADGTATERPTDPNEVVSICGARTKKGTPCTRRVRGTGRCWQHKGLPAMLPASKLIVPG